MVTGTGRVLVVDVPGGRDVDVVRRVEVEELVVLVLVVDVPAGRVVVVVPGDAPLVQHEESPIVPLSRIIVRQIELPFTSTFVK